MNHRRRFLHRAAALGAAPMLAPAAGLGLWSMRDAHASDYRALVCINLNGGNDGNDTLVPIDAAYDDYAAARADLALARDSLVPLAGISAGHRFGLHPGLAALAPLYQQQRLAWIANVGPLVEPVTAPDVRAHVARVPPFLLSHSDQVAIQQGWTGDEDQSGWGGRALETLAPQMLGSMPAISMSSLQTLVMGRHSRVTRTHASPGQYWGTADLTNSGAAWTRALERLGRLQSANAYESEYATTLGASFRSSTEIANAFLGAPEPQATFPGSEIGDRLRFVARLLPALRSSQRRQIILIDWGSFDTHTAQRGSGAMAQDSQLAQLGAALAAFDQAIRSAGMDQEVVSFILSDFGRTLQPASGGGTDHGWGNHLFVLGGPVLGGQVYGSFPALVRGGPDDGDPDHEGRWVPTTSTDQMGATLVRWLGVAEGDLIDVFPNLANFTSKTLPFLAL